MIVAVAIPAYNEEKSIAKIVIKSRKYADEILVIDDGSKDDTALISESLGVSLTKHSRNIGKGAALWDAFAWAKHIGADVLVTIDADGQHDPAKIPMLIDALEANHADVALGSRIAKPLDMPFARWIGVRLLNLAVNVRVEGKVVDAQCGFRAYSRRAIESLAPTEDGMAADSQILVKADRAGMRIVEVPVLVAYTGLETSTHNPLIHALDVFLGLVKFVSIRHPLLFYCGFGLVALANSVFYGTITLDYYHRWARNNESCPHLCSVRNRRSTSFLHGNHVVHVDCGSWGEVTNFPDVFSP